MSNSLDKIKYTSINGTGNRGTAFNILMKQKYFRDYAAKFTFLMYNNSNQSVVPNGYKNQLDFCTQRDVHYSEFMKSWGYTNSGYERLVRSAITKSNGIIMNDSTSMAQDMCYYILKHISASTINFNVALPGNMQKIKLNGALSPNNKIDTDADGLTDWNEIDRGCGLIKWNSSGNIILPTLREYINKSNKDSAINSIFNTYRIKYPKQIDNKLNTFILPITSNPCSMDSDGDKFKDKEDPHKLSSDIKITQLLNPNYVNIDYNDTIKWNGNTFKDTQISYGSNQGWFANNFYKDKLYDSNSIKGKNINDSGCGLIAACDTFVYISLNSKYNFSNTWSKIGFKTRYTILSGQSPVYAYIRYNSLNKALNYYDYMSYIGLMASRFNVSTKLVTGVWPVNVPGSLPWEFNNLFKESKVNLHAYWDTNKNYSVCKSKIEKMLKNNIPVVFCFDNTTNTKKRLNYYESTDLCSYKRINDVGCHYMTVTRLIEYMPDVVKLTGHKTLLQVSSWSNKYYIDFEEYSKYLSKYFSNMLVIN